jgi:hypothetical protein
MPPAGQAVPWTKTPAPLPKRVPQEAELAVGLRQVQNQPEVTDRFIEEVIVREKDALCAFHYLFHCYKIWRASCSLLATQLTESSFASALQASGISTNFERKLFLHIRTHRLAA